MFFIKIYTSRPLGDSSNNSSTVLSQYSKTRCVLPLLKNKNNLNLIFKIKTV